MRFALLICVFAAFATVLTGPATAQGRAFVQIEAHPNLGEATSRARAYGSIVTDINGFALGGRWYAIALGPYDTATATATLRRLRAEGLIPRDSYISDGSTYRDRFWPVGAGAIGAPVPAAPLPPAPVDEAPETASAPAAPDPVIIPEETRREAERSEQLLSLEERMNLQRGLQWFGFYTAAIDGSFGRGTRNSMAAWQTSMGVDDVTGILTTRQRARLLEEYRVSQQELGLQPVTVAEAGVSLIAPLGLVAFDRIEAPFVHYEPAQTESGDTGVRLSIISQAGDQAVLGGLFEILQTLEIVPMEGERSKSRDEFRITGVGPDRTTQIFAKLDGSHIVGYILSWPEAQNGLALRALPEMDRTLASSGAPLAPEAGFEPSEQSFDMVSGLDVRQPLRSASGFFVDGEGAVVTAAETLAGCSRVTLDRLHEAEVALAQDGIAVLRPRARLAPVEVAALTPTEGRLRSAVSVGGFPFGGVLGAATLSFGTLEDVRDLDGDEGVIRLSLVARDGDVGGPVLDQAGRVTAMLLPDPVDGTRALPADVTFAAKARVLQDVLTAAGITARTSATATPIAPEDLTTRAVGMTVLVSCWE